VEETGGLSQKNRMGRSSMRGGGRTGGGMKIIIVEDNGTIRMSIWQRPIRRNGERLTLQAKVEDPGARFKGVENP